MRLKLAAVLVVLGVSGALAQSQVQSSAWPPLPAKGFISGRPATDEDVANGNAIFVLKAHGVYFGKPVDMAIPQFAYLKRGGKTVPVIIIQAEQERSIKIFGVRGLDGDASVAKEPELQLLGTKPPG
jgi:hypothetical protein